MPRPSSYTPRPVSPSVPKQRFTLAQANKTLPLVRRIVGDVVRVHDRAVVLQQTIESMGDGKDTNTVQTELKSVMTRLQDYVTELRGIGCEVKDYRTGLIDFIGEHQGRDICLCWKLGEETIAFWHEMNAGFAGRKPVSQLGQRAV